MVALFVAYSLFSSLSAWAQDIPTSGGHFRLKAPLDEPEFYCLDIAGWGDHLKLNDPLQSHTCKLSSANDQMFHFTGRRLVASNYGSCVQVAGSSKTTLPGSAVLVRPCADDNPLQDLALNKAGKLQVLGTDYCLGAGAESRPASGPSHMWRTLMVVSCDEASPALSTWQAGL